MPIQRCKTKILLAASALLLTLPACSDDWGTQNYEGTPYAGERTAGYGVEYVRAHLLPERGPSLEPVSEPMTTPDPGPAVEAAPPPAVSEYQAEEDYTDDLLQQGEVVFDRAQRK